MAVDVVLNENASQCSRWSMTEYGALDWDHSGNEYESTQARAKTTRSVSNVSPKNAAKVRAAFMNAVMPTRRKAHSAPPSGNRNTCVTRDLHGRFARKTTSSSPVQTRMRAASTPAGRGSVSLRSKRESPTPPTERIDFSALNLSATKLSKNDAASSLVSVAPGLQNVPTMATSDAQKTKPAAKRDSKGRFVPKNNSINVNTQDVVVAGIPHVDKPVLPAKIKVKRQRAPAKSPYFTPPVTPKTPKVKKEASAAVQDFSQKPSPNQTEDTPPSSQSSAKKRIPAKTVSCIPFPPLSASHFGLIQEKLAHDPFRLLIAVTFLNRTHGKHAIPVFYSLMDKYPTPEELINADKADIVSVIQHLGLQNQRAATYQTYANIWVENPPSKDKRYPVRGYPHSERGRDIKKGETVTDSDPRFAWEIGHMTQGPYAIDSWRIFCRDVLRGVAEGYNGEGTEKQEGFQPEWMRVLPEDKELRAYLRWMWLKEGFEWDPFTGEKEVAGEELMRASIEGRVAWDDQGGMRILDDVMVMESGLSQIGHV
ncbi:related to 5-methylcytosine G/T mismatch-specific DNA glycosylase [Rhynchosporium secalis]|uniref:Related to 5-methylcytosine G/T mismatch-specific DNA glycosylase n=1 Tax=Rhynchosporium secalis TaxID=38038 RepID=A0A1E1ML30_RHYSE|nr:related to 5-methylcytosine G/T mismatch-specific DNA glycosylase [Rhynchosporium secalis]